MQFLSISRNLKLSELSSTIGRRNVDAVLNANSLTRTTEIGKKFYSDCDDVIRRMDNLGEVVTNQRKYSLLNTFTSNSDVFEYAALADETDWKMLSSKGTFYGKLKIPETITLTDSSKIIGNSVPIKKAIYESAMYQMYNHGKVDPAIFLKSEPVKAIGNNTPNQSSNSSNPFQLFNLPWGKISLYSSLSDSSMDFPCYPENLSDGRSATYDTMPDMIYQYEPWQVYKTSGPRQIEYVFDIHRDMWSGNHLDGQCNELIRFCEANCYPEYRGSAVVPPTVTLYIEGKPHISGVLVDVRTDWDGPIGQDGWYLHVQLKLSVIEVAKEALSHSVILNKGLIS